MSMDYVRKTYGVSVKRGQRVAFEYAGERRLGTVASANQYVRVRFDGTRHAVNIHPTDPCLNYTPTEGSSHD